MVQNVKKTDKKFSDFFSEPSRFIEKSLSVGLVTRNFFIGSGGPKWSKMWRKPIKMYFSLFKVKVKFDDLENVTKKSAMLIS